MLLWPQQATEIVTVIAADVMDAATDVIVLAALTEQNPQKRREKSNKTKKQPRDELGVAFYGADYGARTRHLHLGKVALYQMS